MGGSQVCPLFGGFTVCVIILMVASMALTEFKDFILYSNRAWVRADESWKACSASSSLFIIVDACK